MTVLHSRAREQLPTVLLTLLGIIQALALDLLWTRVGEAAYLYEQNMMALVGWIQVAAIFLGIILIWVIYANDVLRFRWVPQTSDSVVPFFVGILQFVLIELSGPETLGLWFLFMALIFILMTWVGYATNKRARQDRENDAFFKNVAPADMTQHLVSLLPIALLLMAGLFHWLNQEGEAIAVFTLLGTNGLLAWQFYRTAAGWQSSFSQT